MHEAMPRQGATHLFFGDEAVGLAALHAGIAAAYSYPGTPATEIFEAVLHRADQYGVTAHWCVNEKSAYEQALGVSLAGRRALVSMKHVGLNVAADPFVGSALVGVRGGLVLAVADDPGMHSSQNEQDSRLYAAFAKIPCLEPGDPQQAYDLVREAFALSERHHVPVMVRLVTRVCHVRGPVVQRPAEIGPPAAGPHDPTEWTLLPVYARRRWAALDALEDTLAAEAAARAVSTDGEGPLAVVTAGIAGAHFAEAVAERPVRPPHLHLPAYPIPAGLVRALASRADRILVLEEGRPFVERAVRGLLPGVCAVWGRDSGHVPPTGELDPDSVRHALDLPAPALPEPLPVPPRLPRLCDGCPHRDALAALDRARETHPVRLVTGDIGCYSLGTLPPDRTLQTCVCMGASIGMAKGAADVGDGPTVAVIGDSTFVHSGLAPLADAAARDSDLTVLVLDNHTVAMTGQQPPALDPERLVPVILALGADPDHVHHVASHPRKVDALADLIRAEIAHRGLSVIVVSRPCVQAIRTRKRAHHD